jgi:hypothetical protein
MPQCKLRYAPYIIRVHSRRDNVQEAEQELSLVALGKASARCSHKRPPMDLLAQPQPGPVLGYTRLGTFNHNYHVPPSHH